jgi:ferredoxin
VPRVTYLPLNKTIEFDPSSLPAPDHGKAGSLLHVSDHFGIPHEHVCGGFCSCTTCNVLVLEGAENLSPQDDDEADLLMSFPDGGNNFRLACQAVVTGDVVVQVPGQA